MHMKEKEKGKKPHKLKKRCFASKIPTYWPPFVLHCEVLFLQFFAISILIFSHAKGTNTHLTIHINVITTHEGKLDYTILVQ